MKSASLPILIVEDDSSILGLVVELLTDAGFQTFGATSGAQVFKMLEEIPTPKLILVDCLMTGMSGSEFIKELKKRFPRVSDSAYFVGISGLLPGTSVTKEFETLIHYYEKKPYELNDWIELVQKHLPLVDTIDKVQE